MNAGRIFQQNNPRGTKFPLSLHAFKKELSTIFYLLILLSMGREMV
jgi:hypothetical protein